MEKKAFERSPEGVIGLETWAIYTGLDFDGTGQALHVVNRHTDCELTPSCWCQPRLEPVEDATMELWVHRAWSA